MANKASEIKIISFNQQDFEQLRSQCLQTGSLFCDPTFPASSSSLGKDHQGVEWKRPKELCSHPKFIVDEATRTDICQGSMGDCWLMAGMASLTLDPQILNRVVPPAQSFRSLYAGIFHFQLWQFGKWVDVVVDDRLPTRHGKLLFNHSAEKREFWSALLEKAYAKVNGSYEALNGGYSSESFEDFTGGISESYDLTTSPPFLFNILKKALTFGSLLGCSIQIGSSSEMEAMTRQKLVKGHAYSITAAEQVHHLGSLVDLVRIRNPWGHNEWTGAWSDDSKEWKEIHLEEKKKLNYSADDGEFWMSYKDFQKHFSDLDICHLTPDMLSSDDAKRWHYTEFEGQWKVGSTAGGCSKYPASFCSNPQFFICLEDVDGDPHEGVDGCTVLIGLMQKVSRKDKQNLTSIGFTVYKVPNEFKGHSNVHLGQDVLQKLKVAAHIKAFSKQREVCERFKLPPGDYIIIPSTFEPNHQRSFILRVLTEKKAQTRLVHSSGQKGPGERVTWV